MDGCGHESSAHSSNGFSLVEALVAMALFTGALVSVAQLVVLVSASTMTARHLSASSILAEQKLNQLESQALSELAPSAPDAWMQSSAGFVEFLNGAGAVLAGYDGPPDNAAYVRRWSITPLSGDPAGGVVVQVATGPIRRRPDGTVLDARPSEIARVLGVRTRLVP